MPSKVEKSPRNSKASAARALPKASSGRRTARRAPIKPGPRSDLGAPIEGFFVRQPPKLRAILDELRKLVEEVAPDTHSSIKWGMPFFTLNGKTMCALGAHRAHVNLILVGPPKKFLDPQRRLSGEAKVGRKLKLASVEELPRASVRGWLRTAAKLARS
jgi:hypothetical protein